MTPEEWQHREFHGPVKCAECAAAIEAAEAAARKEENERIAASFEQSAEMFSYLGDEISAQQHRGFAAVIRTSLRNQAVLDGSAGHRRTDG